MEEEEVAIPSTNDLVNKICQNELERDPNLSQEEMGQLTDEEMKNKEIYANTQTNKEKKALEAQLLEKAQSMTQPEEFRKSVANIISDAGSFGHNPAQKLGDMTEDFAKMISGQLPIVYKDKKAGHELSNGEWMSFDQIIESLNTKKIDESSKAGMKALLDDAVRKAEAIQPEEDSTFNYQKEFNNVKNKIVESGDINSLAHDKIFGNRVFADDLKSAIKLGTYKQMGIPDQQVQDPTPEDGRITETDAKIISEKILNDKDILKEYLSEYYTKALEQNWDNNLSQEVKANKKINQTKPQSLKGGTINENGVFVPNE
tara:strand:+ start:139 stop:1086 length:948 start_codon:yes stop_codon:yes gene_type:complete